MVFENEVINGIHKSRYVASWLNAHGGFSWYAEFSRWLETLIINGRHLTEEEEEAIVNYAINGKLELEMNAKIFIQQRKDSGRGA